MSSPAPVEYAAAVERFLGQAALGPASRRVYRISLASWSWPLVGRPAPRGAGRRGATPPFVPLARLDDPETGPALAAALRDRAAGTDVRTVNRELSALRSAVPGGRTSGGSPATRPRASATWPVPRRRSRCSPAAS